MPSSLIGTPNKTRVRRTKAAIYRLWAAMAEELAERHPQHLYCRMTVRGLVDKTEAGRLAVNPDQIKSLDLPSRPVKASDSRAKSFSGAAVEAEAIPVDVMQDIVREVIEEFIDPDLLSVVDAAETSERELLHRWADAVEGRP